MRYERAKKNLVDDCPEKRTEIAKNAKTPPEILYYLAVDTTVEVREAVAGNAATPVHAAKILAKDTDVAVRENLVKRIDRILPMVSENEKTKVRDIAINVVETLARDEVVRIRQAVADVVKDMTDIPHHIIKTLADDAELSISLPVIENSPLLTDEDLIEMISQHPESKKIPSIAKRKDISEEVTDSIAASKNVDAISVMLENKTAQIREETLDMIISQAPSIQQWHQPLVTRPELPPKAVGKLIEFVAGGLLTQLEQTQKISPKHREQIEKKIKAKAEEKSNQKVHIELLKQNPQEWANVMFQKGKLTEDVLLEQIKHNHREAVIAGISLLSKIPVFVLNYAFASANPRLLVSVSWKSNLSMDFAYDLQKTIGKLEDDRCLKSKDGSFPISEEDMETELRSLYR